MSVDGLDGDFFHGASEKQQKALILLGGSEGGKSWSDQTEFIQELVGQGFCVLSLGYFGTGDLPADLRGIPLEYFAKAFHWLSTQEGLVVPNDYAVMGVSRGAELALLLGSRYPKLEPLSPLHRVQSSSPALQRANWMPCGASIRPGALTGMSSLLCRCPIPGPQYEA